MSTHITKNRILDFTVSLKIHHRSLFKKFIIPKQLFYIINNLFYTFICIFPGKSITEAQIQLLHILPISRSLNYSLEVLNLQKSRCFPTSNGRVKCYFHFSPAHNITEIIGSSKVCIDRTHRKKLKSQIYWQKTFIHI